MDFDLQGATVFLLFLNQRWSNRADYQIDSSAIFELCESVGDTLSIQIEQQNQQFE